MQIPSISSVIEYLWYLFCYEVTEWNENFVDQLILTWCVMIIIAALKQIPIVLSLDDTQDLIYKTELDIERLKKQPQSPKRDEKLEHLQSLLTALKEEQEKSGH